MQAKWDELIPRDLASQNPSSLVRFARLANAREGRELSALLSDLGILQSHGSKLAKKLLAEGWLKVTKDPSGDHRKKILRTTDSGLAAMDQLESALGIMLTPPAKRSRVRPNNRHNMIPLIFAPYVSITAQDGDSAQDGDDL